MEAAFHPELRLTPSLAQVVRQLRMELFGLGPAEELEETCRLHALDAARNLVDSSLLLTDCLREVRLQVEAASYNLHTTRIDWLGSVLPNRFSCKPWGRAGVPADLVPAEGCVLGFGVIHDCRKKDFRLKKTVLQCCHGQT